MVTVRHDPHMAGQSNICQQRIDIVATNTLLPTHFAKTLTSLLCFADAEVHGHSEA